MDLRLKCNLMFTLLVDALNDIKNSFRFVDFYAECTIQLSIVLQLLLFFLIYYPIR